MKTLFFAITFVGLIKTGSAQTDVLVGAWLWSDSTTNTSLFFKSGGKVLTHTGPKDGVILTKDLEAGTYTFKDNQLTIKWKDGKVQNGYLKFIDKYSFQITFIDKQNKNQKHDFVFRKVVGEEVIEK